MSGNHDLSGKPIDHHHDHDNRSSHGHRPQIFLPRPPVVRPTRRAFLGDVGKGTIALAVLSPAVLAACSSSSSTNTTDTAAPGTTAASQAPAPETSAAAEAQSTTTPAGEEADEALRWARANLGFVSAYVLARGNKAAIVDTGTAGSGEAIGESLQSLGLNYSDVEHVILTHKHGDHAGSIAEVVGQAVNAQVYAGEADLSSIDADDIAPLLGGEDVFGFETIATPGHTAGHMAVIDHAAGLLIAGDAIFSEGGGVVEGPERFFEDIPTSRDSIRAMAELTFNTLLVGHGDPIEANADTAVAALAASLG